MLIRILKSLFGIYAAIIFAILLVLAVLCYIILFATCPDDKAPHWAHRYISRRWAKSLFIAYLVRVKIRNAELINPDKTYVFIANHRSQLDIPAYALASKNTIRFLAKEELTKILLMGYVIRKLYVSVKRKDKKDRSRSMEAMMKSLYDNISVFICPEGTRNRTDQPLLDFRDGAFRLAIESQLPLAVLTIKNSAVLLSPLRPIELSPGVMECIWSKPIETKGMTMEDLPRLKEMARVLMIENLK